MTIETALPQDMYVQTPPEAATYSRTLETGVVALETTLQRLEAASRHLQVAAQKLQEQVQQDSHTSLQPPSSDPSKPERRARCQRFLHREDR
jgi:hypothetical protein